MSAPTIRPIAIMFVACEDSETLIYLLPVGVVVFLGKLYRTGIYQSTKALLWLLCSLNKIKLKVKSIQEVSNRQNTRYSRF